MIVADTNVIVPLLVRTAQSAVIEQLYSRKSDWYAPQLWRSELTNVLLTFVRKQLITPPEARTALNEAPLVVPPDNELRPDPQDILALALASGCTAYDCEYIATAKLLGIPLATWDKQLLTNFPNDAFTPEHLLNI